MTENATNIYSASDIAKMVAPELGHAFWQNAKVVMPSGAAKVPISMRLDPEVIAWFKQSGKGYLSRMNAVLKAYVDAQQAPGA
jgi:uncharacterized protein (DUF4415 family)